MSELEILIQEKTNSAFMQELKAELEKTANAVMQERKKTGHFVEASSSLSMIDHDPAINYQSVAGQQKSLETTHELWEELQVAQHESENSDLVRDIPKQKPIIASHKKRQRPLDFPKNPEGKRKRKTPDYEELLLDNPHWKDPNKCIYVGISSSNPGRLKMSLENNQFVQLILRSPYYKYLEKEDLHLFYLPGLGTIPELKSKRKDWLNALLLRKFNIRSALKAGVKKNYQELIAHFHIIQN